MAEVEVQQTPPERGTPGWVWAIVVLVVVAILAYVVLNRGVPADDADLEVNVEAPAVGDGAGDGN